VAIKYDKEHVKPDGRKLIRGGPRDLQRRQAQTTVVEQLREDIRRMSVAPATEGYTGEQVDEEVRKAVASAIEEVKNANKEKEIELIGKLKVLETMNAQIKIELDEVRIGAEGKLKSEITELLEQQGNKIEELTFALNNAEAQLELEHGRPKMGTTFIDPLERDAGSSLKSHIKIDNVKGISKEEIKSKVEKLRDLMGKLPNG
jgi:hypothetical protein